MEERRGSIGCRGGFTPPSGEVILPLQRQIDHRIGALFGPRTYPRRLTPCLMIVNAVITCIAYG